MTEKENESFWRNYLKNDLFKKESKFLDSFFREDHLVFFFILAALFLPVNGQLFKNPVSGRGKGLVHFRKFSVYLVMVKVFHDESKNYFVLSKIYRTCVMKLTKDHQ